jgi:hypothetical protein
MSYAFNDIKHILQPYLDDLTTIFPKRKYHIDHLHQTSIRCQHDNIRLNPHKCIFVVEHVHLLGFSASRFGITFYPLKVEAIIILFPLVTINQLQKLQGQ